MLTSTNKKMNTLFRLIGTETMTNIEQYIIDLKGRKYITFESDEQIATFFCDYIAEFYSNSSPSDIENIRYYTGIAFNAINSILRGFWDYEKNGPLTDDRRKECMKHAEGLSVALMKVPNSLPLNIRTYRGVGISSFKDYNISNIAELENLRGQYYYESGFTSTSLLRDRSFFDRELEWHYSCNIEIEYFIPQECSEGLPLIKSDLSYSKEQSEFLIDKGCLSKIIDVEVSKDGTKAYLKAVVIPRRVWNMTYVKNEVKRI